MSKDLIQSGDHEITKDHSYQTLLEELQSILSKGQYQAYKAVDNIKVQTYWQIGERVVREELKHKDRADYGKYLIGSLASDLGFHQQRLYEIVKFYRVYPIFRTVSGKLSWSHYVDLIEIEDDKKRLFYQNKTALNSWSVRELRKQIKGQLYENSSRDEIEDFFKTKLPATTDPIEIFKDQYDFRPMGLQLAPHKDLEEMILGNIKDFLKAFGEDFAFLGHNIPIKISGKTHSIDLVLYHRGIPCVVLVDLKTGKFCSDDVGQMNKYVGYYRRHRQYEHEKDCIGLIICREADKEEVIYALDGLEEKIFVAEYRVKLPSEEKIKKAMRKLER